MLVSSGKISLIMFIAHIVFSFLILVFFILTQWAPLNMFYFSYNAWWYCTFKNVIKKSCYTAAQCFLLLPDLSSFIKIFSYYKTTSLSFLSCCFHYFSRICYFTFPILLETFLNYPSLINIKIWCLGRLRSNANNS